jgi:TonB family protein
MTAMTVPPPGWTSLGHRDLAASRRSFEQGLALSALAHLGALALIVWLSAQWGKDEILLYSAPAHVRVVPRFEPPPLIVHSGGPAKVANGRIVPSDRAVDPPIVLPKIDPGAATRGVLDSGSSSGPGPSDAGSGHVAAGIATGEDPAEDAFVPFDEPPVPIFRPDPAYSEWAREQHVEGRVVLHALVGQDGRVRRVTVIQGVWGLTENAQEALYRWKFRPAHVNRQPVAVWVEVPFEFRL